MAEAGRGSLDAVGVEPRHWCHDIRCAGPAARRGRSPQRLPRSSPHQRGAV
jgi:hypothetical protein